MAQEGSLRPHDLLELPLPETTPSPSCQEAVLAPDGWSFFRRQGRAFSRALQNRLLPATEYGLFDSADTRLLV